MPQLAMPPGVEASLTEHAIWWTTFHHRVFPLCSPAMGPHTHITKDNGDWVNKPCPETQWGKRPLDGIKWGSQATKDEDIIREWWSQYPDANIGGTPDDGFVWIDVDCENPGVEFPPTFRQSTSAAYKHHLLYSQPLDPTRQLGQTQPGSQYWPGVDTRVAGKGYVVLAPSIHHTGKRYAVAHPIAPTEFPVELIPSGMGGGAVRPRLAGKVEGHPTKDREVVDLLNTIVTDPGNALLGNDAFAKMASRLAKMCDGDLPMFRAWLRVTSAAIDDPLSDTDVSKLEGIWHKTEEGRLKAVEKVVEDGARGWLYEMGEAGYSTPVGKPDTLEYVPWSNFRVTAKSLVDYGDHQVWVVDFVKADGSVLEDVELPSDVLASTPRLRAFLVNRGMSLLAPTTDKRGNHGERLLCLLQSQEFERQTVLEKFGWDTALSAFVTPDSLITADSVTSANNHLKIKNTRLSYGFDSGAVEALREFLTFQDELTMSLLGSFLMVIMLKGHYSYQPPNLAVEAHAGSGKSTYLRMLGQLCGVKREPGHFTLPVARDAYAISSNIFNWFDDVPMTNTVQDLFRQSGTGGAYELKDKASGFTEEKIVHLHASTVATAERITFMDQKAMTDRFLMIPMPSADKRVSVKDASRSQWHDVDDFFAKRNNKDLTRYAGALVQTALQHTGIFDRLEDLTESTTRPGQMVAVMRCGARVLAAILGDESHVSRVDAWAETFNFNLAPSLVVNQMIPRVWATLHQPENRYSGLLELHSVFFDSATQRFWVAPNQLARDWPKVARRMEDREAALTDTKAVLLELKNIGVDVGGKGAGKRWYSQIRNGGEQLTYYMVPGEYTEIILNAAIGSTDYVTGEESSDD